MMCLLVERAAEQVPAAKRLRFCSHMPLAFSNIYFVEGKTLIR
jgi:hypothetical protein